MGGGAIYPYQQIVRRFTCISRRQLRIQCLDTESMRLVPSLHSP